ncbi:hypothetical protein BKA62DRAFT_429701 [Auriculariales sp. MPI-PUGE-AT-0066]|nr:hypothetical protein BKA62DRAFT_429701 [Auriculariales sp. MPI-PUGE-AT-0066]
MSAIADVPLCQHVRPTYSSRSATMSETFSQGIQNAVIVSALAGLLSCFAVSFLLVYITSAAIMSRTKSAAKHSDQRAFLQRQLGVFVLCLLVSDFIQSISGMIQFQWAAHRSIHDGSLCRTQAAMLLAGDLGVCIWNAVVAMHTFMAIVLRRTLSTWAVIFVLVLGWAAILLLTIIGPMALQDERGPFFGHTRYWCFVTDPYSSARLWLHYVPIFISLFVIFVLYVLVFLSLRGFIVMGIEGSRFKFVCHTPEGGTATAAVNLLTQRSNADIARKMLWYPAAYVLIVLPIASARLAAINHQFVPSSIWMFAIVSLFLSGFINVTIYTATRRALRPAEWLTTIAQQWTQQRKGQSTGSKPSHRWPKTSYGSPAGEGILITRVEESYDERRGPDSVKSSIESAAGGRTCNPVAHEDYNIYRASYGLDSFRPAISNV